MNEIKELSARLDGLERRYRSSVASGRFGVLKRESIIEKFTAEKVIHSLGTIKQEKLGETAVQVVLNLSCEEENAITIELYSGEMLLYKENRNVVAGENEIFLMNTFSLAKGEEADLSIAVSSTISSNYLKNATLYLWSESATIVSGDHLSVSGDKSDDSFIISYLIDNKVYYLTGEEFSAFDFEDFSYYAEAKAVDCAILKLPETVRYIFRLASDGNIYYSTTGNVQDEKVCVSGGGVQDFSVSAFNERSGVLICYVKNDYPYYKTIEGEKLSLESEFPAKKSKKYYKICALKSGGASNYVVVSTASNANFLFELAPDLNFGGSAGDKLYCSATISYL